MLSWDDQNYQNNTITKASSAFVFADSTLIIGFCTLRSEWETGHISNGDVLKSSSMYTKLENKTIGLPPTRYLLLGNETILM